MLLPFSSSPLKVSAPYPRTNPPFAVLKIVPVGTASSPSSFLGSAVSAAPVSKLLHNHSIFMFVRANCSTCCSCPSSPGYSKASSREDFLLSVCGAGDGGTIGTLSRLPIIFSKLQSSLAVSPLPSFRSLAVFPLPSFPPLSPFPFPNFPLDSLSLVSNRSRAPPLSSQQSCFR